MADLTRDDILKLSQLARLELTEEEIPKYQAELSKILDYVEKLQAVDMTGLQPTTQVTGLTDVTRPDEVENYGYEPCDLLKNVPQTADGQIKVRKIL